MSVHLLRNSVSTGGVLTLELRDRRGLAIRGMIGLHAIIRVVPSGKRPAKSGHRPSQDRFIVLTTSDLAKLLNLRGRTVRERLKRRIAQGFLRPRDEHAGRIRSVVLTEGYEELAQAVREDPERYRYLLGD